MPRSSVVRINVSICGAAGSSTAMVATAWVGDSILCASHGVTGAAALAGVHEQAKYVRGLKKAQRAQRGR